MRAHRLQTHGSSVSLQRTVSMVAVAETVMMDSHYGGLRPETDRLPRPRRGRGRGRGGEGRGGEGRDKMPTSF